MFKNRQQAGNLLAAKLEIYQNKDGVFVLGMPRGGVVTAAEIAKSLNLPLEVIITRKIGAPLNPEYAIGAVSETGEAYLNEAEVKALAIDDNYLHKLIQAEIEKIRTYQKLFRQNQPLPDFSKKTVILVDDGIATGFTMRAAIKALKKQKVRSLIVAVPVLPLPAVKDFKKLVDKLVFLTAPIFFYAIGAFYEDFSQVTSQEVKDLLKSYNETK